MAATTTVKRRTILTWLIDTGFLSDREKVFYVPVNSGEGKVISGVVTRTGVHCGCCDAVVSLPAFRGARRARSRATAVVGKAPARVSQLPPEPHAGGVGEGEAHYCRCVL